MVVLAVHNGGSAEKVGEVARERGYEFAVGADRNGAIHRAYQITLRPTTVMIGPDGKVLAVRAGAHTVEQWQEVLAGLSR